jgi:hydrogenase maturation protein HypF
MLQTFQISISGQVQGVGFRPFVYREAVLRHLKGDVCNNGAGVLVRFNATKIRAQDFLNALLTNAPKVAQIQSYHLNAVEQQKFTEFKIQVSVKNSNVEIPITPDFAICGHCKTEILNEENRRFGYAFTTCTECGPRFSITKNFPFERGHTSMQGFNMCPECHDEYSTPINRRFHSQTNSCASCGIELEVTNAEGLRKEIPAEEIPAYIAKCLSESMIVALKNTNGYLLCCDAQNKEAIANLRTRKNRPGKPFALMYPSLEYVQRDFYVSQEEEKDLLSPVAPIVILSPKKNTLSHTKEAIAPNLRPLGVMLPSSALLTLVAKHFEGPIIATSGNIHGSPIISEKSDALKKLGTVADVLVHHNLQITFPQDDSVVKWIGTHRAILRRSRGLAPNLSLKIAFNNTKVLAMGAHLKSTYALHPNKHIYVSPYLGNLDSHEVLERFKTHLEQFQNLFGSQPEIILIDRHPQYQSSSLGEELASVNGIPIQKIQHHKAHFSSVLGEHDLFSSTEKILGVVWDGTGFGDDAAIWGGEFFDYHEGVINRLCHFNYFEWLAGDKMSKEPRLSLLSLWQGEEIEELREKFNKTEGQVYQKILEKNKLKTSSVGRLFDAVASLLNLCDYAFYEGEAAMLLENCASEFKGDEKLDFLKEYSHGIVPTQKLMIRIIQAYKDGVTKEKIAFGFIFTLAMIPIKIAQHFEYKTVACSGGVFQNAILLKELFLLALTHRIELKLNCILSSNDENISFGQLCYYQHIKN